MVSPNELHQNTLSGNLCCMLIGVNAHWFHGTKLSVEPSNMIRFNDLTRLVPRFQGFMHCWQIFHFCEGNTVQNALSRTKHLKITRVRVFD